MEDDAAYKLICQEVFDLSRSHMQEPPPFNTSALRRLIESADETSRKTSLYDWCRIVSELFSDVADVDVLLQEFLKVAYRDAPICFEGHSSAPDISLISSRPSRFASSETGPRPVVCLGVFVRNPEIQVPAAKAEILKRIQDYRNYCPGDDLCDKIAVTMSVSPAIGSFNVVASVRQEAYKPPHTFEIGLHGPGHETAHLNNTRTIEDLLSAKKAIVNVMGLTYKRDILPEPRKCFG